MSVRTKKIKKMKKRIPITISLSILVIVGLSFFVVGVSRFAAKTPSDMDVTKLQKSGEQVAESSSTGDAVKSDKNAQDSSRERGAASAQATKVARSAPEVSRPESVPASPKQTEVRQSTAIERVYYPLAAPNDPGYVQSSWPLLNMNAPAAWDLATGASATVIAVLDTGFALNHDDLKDSWYQNSGETGVTQIGGACWSGISVSRSTNNCDDDSNGYIDDWRGWNFYDGTNNPMAGEGNPSGASVSHGTETAGLAGAKGNNGTGIATINWNTRLMPLQVLSDDGPGYTSDVAAAVYYAVDSGVDVINLSLGGNEPDSVLLAATNYAYANDVVVVAAAGNCGTGTGDACDSYPAGIIGYPARNPHVISVGAVTSAGERASFSSYGDALDVVAPGAGSIYSTTWSPQDGTSLYRTSLNGTSFSAPLVASLASLLKSVRTSAVVDEITALILGTAQKTGISDGIYSTTLGHGIVDAYKAVTVAQSFAGNTYNPVLYQTGNHVSEHRYSQDTSMASGCRTEAVSAYCALWFEQDMTGYDRILPYTLTSDAYTSWTWSSSILGGGTWYVRTIQAGEMSRTYGLSQK
jgi:subtilisin family serine protease